MLLGTTACLIEYGFHLTAYDNELYIMACDSTTSLPGDIGDVGSFMTSLCLPAMTGNIYTQLAKVLCK